MFGFSKSLEIDWGILLPNSNLLRVQVLRIQTKDILNALPEGVPSKLCLGGLVDVAIPRSTPKIPHLFFITNAQ